MFTLRLGARGHIFLDGRDIATFAILVQNLSIQPMQIPDISQRHEVNDILIDHASLTGTLSTDVDNPSW